jgi:hypothetical protein
MALSCRVGHLLKLRLFNSSLFVSVPEDKISEDLYSSVRQKTRKANESARIPIRVTSDGRKGYVRFERD